MTYYLAAAGMSSNVLLVATEKLKVRVFDVIHKTKPRYYHELQCNTDYSQVFWAGPDYTEVYPTEYFKSPVKACEVAVTGVFNKYLEPYLWSDPTLLAFSDLFEAVITRTTVVDLPAYLTFSQAERFPILLRGSSSLQDVKYVYDTLARPVHIERLFQVIPTALTDDDIEYINNYVVLKRVSA